MMHHRPSITAVCAVLCLFLPTGSTGNLRLDQTYIYHDFYLDLRSLDQGFGSTGHDILEKALNDFGETFSDRWGMCVTSLRTKLKVSSVAKAEWDVVTNWDVPTDDWPLRNQFPNQSGDGFVQKVNFAIPEIKTEGTDGVVEDWIRDRCAGTAFEDGVFLTYLNNADKGSDIFSSVSDTEVVPVGDFVPMHEYSTTTGSGAISLEFFPLGSGFGESTGATEVSRALNDERGFLQRVASLWTKGIEKSVPGSKVFSINHFYKGDDGTFTHGPYYNKEYQERKGDLIHQQVKKSRPSVVTDFTYTFRAHWWRPLDFDGKRLMDTDEMALNAFRNDSFLPYLHKVDKDKHFSDVTEVTAVISEASSSKFAAMTRSSDCPVAVSVVCVSPNGKEECNSVKRMNDDCKTRVRYSYAFFIDEDVTLLDVKRYRNEAVMGGKVRHYLKKKGQGGELLSQGTEFEAYEEVCEENRGDTRLQVRVRTADGDLCSVAANYDETVWTPSDGGRGWDALLEQGDDSHTTGESSGNVDDTEINTEEVDQDDADTGSVENSFDTEVPDRDPVRMSASDDYETLRNPSDVAPKGNNTPKDDMLETTDMFIPGVLMIRTSATSYVTESTGTAVFVNFGSALVGAVVTSVFLCS